MVAVNCKISPLEFVKKIWCDSLVHDPDALELLVKKLGVDRIILGSDYPFPLGEQEPGKMVEECDFLTAKDKAKILGLNLLAFLGLDMNLKSTRRSIAN